MSHQQAWVRFDLDGLVMYAEYDGTADQILTPLYETFDACRAAWRNDAEAECVCGKDESAEYVEDYGGGGYGPVRACRHCKSITDSTAFDPHDEGYASSPNEGQPVWVRFPEAYTRALSTLVDLRRHITAPAVVAGGWLRDIFTGDAPKDVDVFVSSEDFEEVFDSLAQNFDCKLADFEDPGGVVDGHNGFVTDHPSSGESVEKVAIVHGLLALEVQVISVPDPVAWVKLFDAYCNRLFVRLHSPDFELEAMPHAIEHAKSRLWSENPEAQESREVLDQRAAKFRARGYTIERVPRETPQLDSLDLLFALEKM